MKIIFKDLKMGQIKLKIENLDDLWYLSNIIEERDLISGKTTRKISYGAPDGKKKIERKIVFISIKATKIDYSNVNILRVLGEIVESPEEIGKGDHHSFELEIGSEIKITKNWLKHQLDWIKESTDAKIPEILICLVDRENSLFAISKKSGYEIISKLKGEVSKKDERDKCGENFYKKVAEILKEYFERYNPNYILIASPAFFKEDLMKELKTCKFKDRIFLAGCSSVNKSGIIEVMKRDEVAKLLEQDKTSKEIKLVEKILKEISKDGKVSYGLNSVEKAVEAGAVELLIISNEFIQKIRAQENYEKIDKFMKAVESSQGKIHIVNSENEAGKKLDGLGGIAAILRFKLSY